MSLVTKFNREQIFAIQRFQLQKRSKFFVQLGTWEMLLQTGIPTQLEHGSSLDMIFMQLQLKLTSYSTQFTIIRNVNTHPDQDTLLVKVISINGLETTWVVNISNLRLQTSSASEWVSLFEENIIIKSQTSEQIQSRLELQTCNISFFVFPCSIFTDMETKEVLQLLSLFTKNNFALWDLI